MSIAERAILSAITELEERIEDEKSFNYKDIAAAIPCSEPTIWRYMPKLIEAGKVERIGNKHSDKCRYKVVNNA